jgi:hypothetical protein
VFFAHFPPELRRAPEWAGVGELSGMDADMHEMSEVGASVGASEVAGPSLPVALAHSFFSQPSKGKSGRASIAPATSSSRGSV